MPEFLVNDTEFYLSLLNEAALNTNFTAGADYIRLLNANAFYILPEMEKSNDANRPGNGHEFATYTCNRYWSHPAISLEDEVNVDGAGRLLMRTMGGSVTDTTLATGVYRHAANMLPLASGRQNPSMDFIARLGGASFLVAGLVGERYRLFQNRADPARYQCDLVGSGKHIRPHGVASLPAGASIIQCIDGNNTVIQWTDSGGVKDWAATGRVRSWFIEVQNSIKLNDRRPGDPYTSNGTDGIAAYTRFMLHGIRQATAQIVVTLDNNVAEWLQMASNEPITDVTFKPQGPIIASSIRASLAMILPNARITSVTSGEDDGDAIATVNLLGYYDAVSGGVVRGECVNATASNFR